MAALSRMQAEAVLEAARAARPLYDDLRPAYTRLDPLVALLRRRGFSGLLVATGGPGQGAVWFERGRLHSGWLLPADAPEVRVAVEDPLAAVRALWGDGEAAVSILPGAPPLPAEATSAPATTRATGQPPPVGAADGTARQRGPASLTEPRAVPLHVLSGIPWARLLPEALARVRRHRGTPLAQQLEDAVNAVLAPEAAVAGRDVRGAVSPERGAAALGVVAAGVTRVAGVAFTERLLLTLGRDFACEPAVKSLLGTPAEGEGAR